MSAQVSSSAARSAAQSDVAKSVAEKPDVAKPGSGAAGMPKPAVAGKASALERRRNFLSEVVIDYGPRDLLAPLFLKADTELRKVGIDMHFAPVEALVELNKGVDPKTWRPLVQTLDPRLGTYNADNGFCMLGRNAEGDIVAVQAVRLYIGFAFSACSKGARRCACWWAVTRWRVAPPGSR